jgi:hypothetical protein
MFSDVIRGKRSLGWRTVLVIPELQSEVDVALREIIRRKRIQELRELRDELDEWIDRLSLLLVSCERDENCVLRFASLSLCGPPARLSVPITCSVSSVPAVFCKHFFVPVNADENGFGWAATARSR